MKSGSLDPSRPRRPVMVISYLTCHRITSLRFLPSRSHRNRKLFLCKGTNYENYSFRNFFHHTVANVAIFSSEHYFQTSIQNNRQTKKKVLHIGISQHTRYVLQHVINPLNTKRRPLYLKTQFVPRSKHFSSRL